MKIRQQRLADQIRDIVASYFLGGKLHDPRLSQVSITAVKLSGDLQIASVYFRIYDKSLRDQAESALDSVKAVLRKQLASTLKVRRVPELRFFYDESIEHADKINTLLEQIKNEP